MKRAVVGLLLLQLLLFATASPAPDERKPALSAAEIISKHLEAAGSKSVF